MTHPTYPLQHEQTERTIAHPEAFIEIRREYDARRDVEYPGWRQTYSEAVMEWMKSQGTRFDALQPVSATPTLGKDLDA